MIKVENLSEINSTVVTCYVTDDLNTMFRYYAEEVKKVKDEKKKINKNTNSEKKIINMNTTENNNLIDELYRYQKENEELKN